MFEKPEDLETSDCSTMASGADEKRLAQLDLKVKDLDKKVRLRIVYRLYTNFEGVGLTAWNLKLRLMSDFGHMVCLSSESKTHSC